MTYCYFGDTYIGRYRRNTPPRRPPLFAINLWNLFNRTDDKLSRTTNSAVTWHRSLQGDVSACHPVFWTFLSVLQKEENMICPAAPPRQRYLDSNRRILRKLDDYPSWQRFQYLRAIARNLTF